MTSAGVILYLLNQFLIATVTICLSWRCFQLKLQKTAMHAYLCTLGFLCLFSESLMARHNHNLLSFHLNVESKTRLQLMLQMIGGFLGIAGTLQKYCGKETHFKSLHAKWGLAACVFCCINFICASFALYSNFRSSNFTNFVHDFLGIATFTAAMICQYYGYETGFFNRNFTKKKLYKFVTFVIFILTAMLPCQILIKKFYTLVA